MRRGVEAHGTDAAKVEVEMNDLNNAGMIAFGVFVVPIRCPTRHRPFPPGTSYRSVRMCAGRSHGYGCRFGRVTSVEVRMVRIGQATLSRAC